MKEELLPYSPTPFPLHLNIEWQLTGERLTIDYTLIGALEQIELPKLDVSKINRAHDLWKTTCFEWFMKTDWQTTYWEFNASPSGEWNFYQLDDYRKNLTESPLLSNPKFSTSIKSTNDSKDEYHFVTDVNISKLQLDYPDLLRRALMAVTTVIRWKSGETSYYALRHPAGKPDFHHHSGFKISLQEYF